MGFGPVSLPWAVHISDGMLSLPWLAGGFAVAGLLALLAAYRVRDEEIPRIALLSSAFFVASLMHLRLGPTSVHLLFNGLVGVVLGRRAPLAIPVGLALQAALLGHGGFTTLGVNACVMTLPALLAGAMFAGLVRLPWMRENKNFLLWLSGFIIGLTAALATLILNAVVLLWGGAEDWHQIVWLVFYAHLPIVGLEAVVLGFTVRFLARVQPEMLGLSAPRYPPSAIRPIRRGEQRMADRLPILLLAALTTLWFANPARAHRLDAGFQVLPDHRVRIESWFDLGGVPKGAKVQVFRPEKQLLAEGQLDDHGCFVFDFTEAEALQVIVSAGAGHRKAFVIQREELEPSASAAAPSDAASEPRAEPFHRIDSDAAWRERFKDALLGVSFLLAAGAFLLSWRNARTLKAYRITQRAETQTQQQERS